MADTSVCVVTGIKLGNAKIIHFAWTSDDTDGLVNKDFEMDGLLHRMVTVPAVGCFIAPDDDYDITVIATGKGGLGSGEDVLYGAGIDRDIFNRETAWPHDQIELTQTDLSNFTLYFRPIAVHGLHTFQVRNAGNLHEGQTWLYVTEGTLHQG